MTPEEQAAYDHGYEAGYRDVRDGLEAGEGSRGDVQSAGSIADHGHTPERESAWWLGYAHGRAAARKDTERNNG